MLKYCSQLFGLRKEKSNARNSFERKLFVDQLKIIIRIISNS